MNDHAKLTQTLTQHRTSHTLTQTLTSFDPGTSKFAGRRNFGKQFTRHAGTRFFVTWSVLRYTERPVDKGRLVVAQSVMLGHIERSVRWHVDKRPFGRRRSIVRTRSTVVSPVRRRFALRWR
eukprot:TRINITY_DN2786_c1_g1_i1.p3 TRINITY_DN2786_c1_g1~~TRINITY_DN2786_c1_g1_i1.p3  ORF type:complete len:122 (+),score=2.18 TRINITY_DN2786_c1_g1_i1:373-738(+)